MIDIKERNKMPHLDREEVTALLTFSGAVPNRQEVRKELASAAKAKEELVVVRQIDPWFGEMKADVKAAIYSSEDSMNKIEGKYMHDRHAVKEAEEPAKESPAEAEAETGEEKAEEPSEEAEKEESAEAPAEGGDASEEKSEEEKADEKEDAPDEEAEEKKESPDEAEEAPAEEASEAEEKE